MKGVADPQVVRPNVLERTRVRGVGAALVRLELYSNPHRCKTFDASARQGGLACASQVAKMRVARMLAVYREALMRWESPMERGMRTGSRSTCRRAQMLASV